MSLITPKQKIFIYISDVASLIGQNKFDFVTPFERLWKKCDSQAFQDVTNNINSDITGNAEGIALLKHERAVLDEDLQQKRMTQRQYTMKVNVIDADIQTKQNQIEVLQSRVDEVVLTQQQRLQKAIGQEIMDHIHSVSVETTDKRNTVKDILDNMEISDEKKNQLRQEAQSYINKTHGTLKEESAIKLFEKKFNVSLDTSQAFHKLKLEQISQLSKYDWYVCGKVDGLYVDKSDHNQSYIVEVKNRTKAFFNTLRDYEKTQIHLYMLMLNMSQAKLVEKLDGNIRITQIFADNTYIRDIIDSLEVFITNFEQKFLTSVDKKAKYVTSSNDDKRSLLRRWFFIDINNALNEKISNQLSKNHDCMIDDLD